MLSRFELLVRFYGLDPDELEVYAEQGENEGYDEKNIYREEPAGVNPRLEF